MGLRLILIASYLLAACSSKAPAPPKEFHSLFERDPVFKAMLSDPKARPHLNDPEFWRAFRDPKIQWQVRMEQSERMYAPPTQAVVDRLEQALSKAECVGSLKSWDRLYTNGQDTKRGGIDPNKVAFSLREAGVLGFRDSREIVRPRSFHTIDDRPYRSVNGSYEIAANKLIIEFCGNNVTD